MRGLRTCYLYFVFAILYCPIAVLIVFSFNNTQYSGLWHGFSLRWYQLLRHDTILIDATKHTIILALSAATLAVIIGTIAAIALYRFKFMGKKFLHGLLFVLILLPDIVTGTSLLLLFTFIKIPLGFTSLLIAHITFCLPFVIILIYTRLMSIDQNIYEAAKDLGAYDWSILFKILVPILLPNIVAAWLLSITLSIDDIVISYFVSGPGFQILPLQIYASLRQGLSPELNALCALMFCVTLILVSIFAVILRKRDILEASV